MGESRDGIRRGIPVGIVVPEVGTPFSPSLKLTLGPGSSVVVTDGLPPLSPSLRFWRGFALVLPRTREIRKGVRRSVLVGVVITDVSTPLSPGC